jgi:hypothetical protein
MRRFWDGNAAARAAARASNADVFSRGFSQMKKGRKAALRGEELSGWDGAGSGGALSALIRRKARAHAGTLHFGRSHTRIVPSNGVRQFGAEAAVPIGIIRRKSNSAARKEARPDGPSALHALPPPRERLLQPMVERRFRRPSQLCPGALDRQDRGRHVDRPPRLPADNKPALQRGDDLAQAAPDTIKQPGKVSR